MTFWVAIITIVAINTVAGVVKEALKRKQLDGSHAQDLVKAIDDQRMTIAALKTELNALKRKVEEQEVFVDEAISQFRPRLERLQKDASHAVREGQTETL